MGKAIAQIYNGFYFMVAKLSIVANPARSAWLLATLATGLYVLALFAVLISIAPDLVSAVPVSERVIEFSLIILLGIVSDLKRQDHWFGAGPCELPSKEQRTAIVIALVYLVCGAVTYIGLNICLFLPTH